MITGRDFIQLANRWSGLPSGGEAVWRTAIGRAYYGSFHVSKDFLIGIGIILPPKRDKKNEHIYVRQALSQSANADAVEAAKSLGELHEYRKSADYYLELNEHDQKLAQHCHFLADDIRARIAKCDASTHAAIRASIQRWQAIIS